MKRISLIFLTILIIPAIILSGCKKSSSDIADHIPSNASLVAIIDLENMEQKLEYDRLEKELGIDQLPFALAMMGIPDFVEDRDVLGLDFSGAVYIMAIPVNDRTTVTGLLPLKDAGKMETFIKAIYDDADFIEGNGFKYMAYEDDYFAWDKNKLMITVLMADDTEAMVLDRITGLFELKKADGLMAGSTIFSNMIKQDHDACLWSKGSMAGNFPEMEIDLPKSDLYEKSELTFDMNFELGQVNFRSEMHFDEENSEPIRQLFDQSFDSKLAMHIPFTDPDAYLSVAFNFKSLSELIGLKEIMNAAFEKMEQEQESRYQSDADSLQVSIEKKDIQIISKLLTSMTGMLFMAADLDDSRDDLAVDFFASAGFDEEAMEMIQSLLTEHDESAEVVPGIYRIGNDSTFYLVLGEDIAYVTGSLQAAQQILSPSEAFLTKLSSEVADKITGFPMYFAIDMQAIANKLSTTSDSESIRARIASFLSGFESMEGVTYEPDGNIIRSDFYITLVDKDHFSLYTLIKLIGKGVMSENLINI